MRRALGLIILSFLLVWHCVSAASQVVQVKKRQVHSHHTLSIAKKVAPHHLLQAASKIGTKQAKLSLAKAQTLKGPSKLHHSTTKLANKSMLVHQLSRLAHANQHTKTLACASKSSNVMLALTETNFNGILNQRLIDYRSSVCATAEAQLGKPYHFGVENPGSGFDCSGLSQFVYAEAGIEIPRTALEQYHNLAPAQHLQEGDLVFFRTTGSRQVSHVGIYIGGGYFVHSPRTGEDIRVDRLANPYWHERYAGARRVLTSSKLAEAGPLLPSFNVLEQAS